MFHFSVKLFLLNWSVELGHSAMLQDLSTSSSSRTETAARRSSELWVKQNSFHHENYQARRFEWTETRQKIKKRLLCKDRVHPRDTFGLEPREGSWSRKKHHEIKSMEETNRIQMRRHQKTSKHTIQTPGNKRSSKQKTSKDKVPPTPPPPPSLPSRPSSNQGHCTDSWGVGLALKGMPFFF